MQQSQTQHQPQEQQTLENKPLKIVNEEEEIALALKDVVIPSDWLVLHKVSFMKEMSHFLPFLVNEKGMDINQKNEAGYTPLHIAISNGNFENVKTLLDLGASLKINTNTGNSPLYTACEYGDLQIVKELLDRGADIHGYKYQFQYQTPLMIAVVKNHIHIVKYLLENGGIEDLDYGDKSNNSPLFVASEMGLIQMMETLLHYGADVNARNGNDNSPLFGAVRKSQVQAVKLLIGHKADINLVGSRYFTPLYIAVNLNLVNMIEVLVEAGANIEARDASYYTPLMSASYANSVKVVKVLIERGANPNAVSNLGYTSLMYAIQKKNLEIVDILLSAPKIDIDVLSEVVFSPTIGERSRYTALLFSVSYGHFDVLKKLLALGANPNIGYPPFVSAFKNKRVDMVEELLKHGAKVETTTFNPLVNIHQWDGPSVTALLKYGYEVEPIIKKYFPPDFVGSLHKLMFKKKGSFKKIVPFLVMDGFFEELDYLTDPKQKLFVATFLGTLNYKVPKIKKLFIATDIVHACRSLHALALICEYAPKKVEEKKKLLNDVTYINLLFPLMAIPESYKLACRTLHLISKEFLSSYGIPSSAVVVEDSDHLCDDCVKTINMKLRNSSEPSKSVNGNEGETTKQWDFRTGTETDTVTFKFENGAQILSDKSTLMTKSKVFSCMFGGAMKESLQKDVNIEVDEYSLEIYKIFIHFLYFNEADIIELNEMEIWSLISLAHRYDVSKLIEMCSKQLETILLNGDPDLESILSCIKLAQTYQVDGIEEFCYDWLCVNLDQFSTSKYGKFVLLGENKDEIDENIVPSKSIVSSLKDFVLIKYMKGGIRNFGYD